LSDVNGGCRAIHVGHALAGRINADQRGALDGDIGRGKAQGGFPRRIDGQKGNIPVLATGVSHHFTRGRIGNEFGADAPARRQPMAELDGDARWLSCLPEMGQDRIAQINGETQPGWFVM